MLDRRLKIFLEKYTLTELKVEYVIKNELLYQKDITNGILRGIYFERSRHDKNGFYLWTFAQPLYIPSENIILTFGKRLTTSENNEWWSFNHLDSTNLGELYLHLNNKITEDGINYLKEVETPDAFYHFFNSKKTQNIRIYQAIVHTLYVIRNNEANGEAGLFLDYVRQTQDSGIKWIHEMIKSTERLLRADPNEIIHLLKEWERETIKNLKI